MGGIGELRDRSANPIDLDTDQIHSRSGVR